MALIVHLSLPEDSPAARAIRRVVESDNLSPEDAVTQILATADSQGPTPAEELIGALSGPEDREILDRAMASARAHRKQFDVIRELGS